MHQHESTALEVLGTQGHTVAALEAVNGDQAAPPEKNIAALTW